MIHFIIGTKAQFIKMMPLMHLLEAERRPYHLLDLGQHAALTRRIVQDFGLNPSVSRLTDATGNVESYSRAASWLSRGASRLLWSRQRLLREYFKDQAGISLIHGDTASTLLGLYLGRRAGLRVGLVEAGLTSGSLLDPFPEEMIRRHAERRADFLFAPDARGAARLRGLGLRGQVVDSGYNTGRDALMLVIRQHHLQEPTADAGEYSVLTLHRLETLGRRALLTQAIDYALQLSGQIGKVRFFLHGPTQAALARHGLLARLEQHPAFELAPLLPYPEFIRQILHCRYLLTDGGSIQEEAAYLGKPCLILRRRTERDDGIGENARLASFDSAADLAFLKDWELRQGPVTTDFSLQASRRILAVAESAAS